MILYQRWDTERSIQFLPCIQVLFIHNLIISITVYTRNAEAIFYKCAKSDILLLLKNKACDILCFYSFNSDPIK